MLFKVILYVLIVSFFVYTKALPHKFRIDPKHRGKFDFFDSIFGSALRAFDSLKPYKIGEGLSLDMAQVVIFMILLALAIFI
jgi:hypothetical protein